MNPKTLVKKLALGCVGAAIGGAENKILNRKTGAWPNIKQMSVAAGFGAGSLLLFAAIERQLGLTAKD